MGEEEIGSTLVTAIPTYNVSMDICYTCKPRPPVHKHDDGAVLVLPLFKDWPKQIDLLTSSRVPHHISTPPLLPHSHHLWRMLSVNLTNHCRVQRVQLGCVDSKHHLHIQVKEPGRSHEAMVPICLLCCYGYNLQPQVICTEYKKLINKADHDLQCILNVH